MAVLVINCGSSSLKVSLFLESDRIDGHWKGLDSDTPVLDLQGMKTFTKKLTIHEALTTLLDRLEVKKHPLLGVGHRFVHGGEHYTSSTPLDDTVIQELESLVDLAPLHNSPSLEGIKSARTYFGKELFQLAVFDTAFHNTMPQVATHYALPHKLAATFKIKRYGFHGISHAYLWNQFSQKYGTNKKILTLHLGAGCSITAIKNGKSLDTSMGFTPCEGLVMATRVGDIDPTLSAYLAQKLNCSLEKISSLYNQKSGLLGVSGISSDMKELIPHYATEPNAKLAIDLFCYRLQKYIGAYITVLEGVDAIIFTGGIGENSPSIRKMVIDKFHFLNILLDSAKNECTPKKNELHAIHRFDSSVQLFVIPADENQFIKEEIIKAISIQE